MLRRSAQRPRHCTIPGATLVAACYFLRHVAAGRITPARARRARQPPAATCCNVPEASESGRIESNLLNLCGGDVAGNVPPASALVQRRRQGGDQLALPGQERRRATHDIRRDAREMFGACRLEGEEMHDLRHRDSGRRNCRIASPRAQSDSCASTSFRNIGAIAPPAPRNKRGWTRGRAGQPLDPPRSPDGDQ